MQQSEREIEMDKLSVEFNNLIEKSIGFKLGSSGFGGSSQNGAPIRFTARFPENNNHLNETPYFLKSTTKVLHFTSMQVLYSIINEGCLRLYNLHNSNDPKEYEYASSCLKPVYNLQNDGGVYADFITRVKENSFILSATNESELNKPFFWKKYGDNLKGVAIELEIINEPLNWRLFYFSKVIYGKLDQIQELSENWHKIQKIHPNNTYQIELNQLLSLHKEKSWADENEIRLYTQIPQVGHVLWAKHIYNDFRIGKADKNIKYFKLPLCDKNGKYLDNEMNEPYYIPYNYFPKLRISNIHFGPEFPLSGKLLYDLTLELKQYASKKNNIWLNNIPINKTNLDPE